MIRTISEGAFPAGLVGSINVAPPTRELLYQSVRSADSPDPFFPFGGEQQFEELVTYLLKVDGQHSTGAMAALKDLVSVDFQLDTFDPAQFLQSFYETCLVGWKNGHEPGTDRPSLPYLNMLILQQHGISPDAIGTAILSDEEKRLASCMVPLAIHAELVRGMTPDQAAEEGGINDYHNTPHFGHVSLFGHKLLAVHQKLADAGAERVEPFSLREMLILQLAWTIHDDSHIGQPNVKGNIYERERASLDAVLPVLRAQGVSEEDIETIEAIVLSTSIDGPTDFARRVHMAHLAGEDMEQFDEEIALPDGKFAAQRKLVESPRVARLAFFAQVPDLGPSALCGIEASALQSANLEREVRKIPGKEDAVFTGWKATLGFLDHVWSRLFLEEPAVRFLGEESFYALHHYHETQRAVASSGPGP